MELMVVLSIVAVMTSMVLMVRGTPNNLKKIEDEGKRLKALISMVSDEAIVTGRELGMQFYQKGYAFLGREDDGKWRYILEKPLGKRLLPPGFRMELTLETRPVELKTEEEHDIKPHMVFGTTGETLPFKLDLQGPNGQRMTLSGNGRGTIQLQRPNRS
ncbi:MAG: hypothetical protein HQL64_01070 [Magnetococcales bacterium]|nr:hypothetical protein [Magnetococcales bacterium]